VSTLGLPLSFIKSHGTGLEQISTHNFAMLSCVSSQLVKEKSDDDVSIGGRDIVID
jgi:hypothetical protein